MRGIGHDSRSGYEREAGGSRKHGGWPFDGYLEP